MTRRRIATVAYIVLLLLFVVVVCSEYSRVRGLKQVHGSQGHGPREFARRPALRAHSLPL